MGSLLIFNIVKFTALSSDVVLTSKRFGVIQDIMKSNGIESFLDRLLIYDSNLTLEESEIEIQNEQKTIKFSERF